MVAVRENDPVMLPDVVDVVEADTPEDNDNVGVDEIDAPFEPEVVAVEEAE